MKTSVLALLAAASLASTAVAQETSTLGYCAGECSKTGSISTEGNKWVSGAIYLPSDLLANYDGAEITGLRAGLASKVNIDCLQVWVRTELDGDNLGMVEFSSSADAKPAKGWNEGNLEVPVSIDASEGIYIGMTYHQKAATNAFSTVGTGLENAFFAQFGQGEEWQDLSASGILSIEALVQGGLSYDYDLGLLSAVLNPNADPMDNIMTVTVVNNGTNDIDGFTLTTTYTDLDESFDNHFDITMAAGAKETLSYSIPKMGSLIGEDVAVEISSLDNAEDQQPANNSIKAVATFRKKVLIEEFTTERCSNCPRVAGHLHTVLSSDEFKDVAVAVCHHAGFYTDTFTQPCDEELVWLYGGGSYAPAMMFDRAPLFREGKEVVISPSLQDIEENARLRLSESADVELAMKAAYDEAAGILTVDVEGKRGKLNMPNPRLTVYVTEDNVKALFQSGATGEFFHDHLIRAYNSTWGDPIAWDGDSFKASFTFDIDHGWKMEDLKAVAAIGNYNEDNFTDCVINNVECIGVGVESGSKVESTPAETITETWYTADGLRINKAEAREGIFIKVSHMADGKVRTEKIIQ